MRQMELTARIKQKADTKANWDKATNFVPMEGEIIIYSDLNEMKVGDGSTHVKDLPFITNVRHSKVEGIGNSYQYYELASFPADNNYNAGSLIVDGRIGGWNGDNKGLISLMISNRDGIKVVGTVAGNADLNLCDLVLYTTGDTSTTNGTTTLYIKTHDYFAFDLTLRPLSGVVDLWQRAGMWTTFPDGTLKWSLSEHLGEFLPNGRYYGLFSANNDMDHTVYDCDSKTFNHRNGCIIMAHGKITNQSGYINITRTPTVYQDYDCYALQAGEDGYWGSSWVTATAFFPPYNFETNSKGADIHAYVHARGADYIYVRVYYL